MESVKRELREFCIFISFSRLSQFIGQNKKTTTVTFKAICLIDSKEGVGKKYVRRVSC